MRQRLGAVGLVASPLCRERSPFFASLTGACPERVAPAGRAAPAPRRSRPWPGHVRALSVSSKATIAWGPLLRAASMAANPARNSSSSGGTGEVTRVELVAGQALDVAVRRPGDVSETRSTAQADNPGGDRTSQSGVDEERVAYQPPWSVHMIWVYYQYKGCRANWQLWQADRSGTSSPLTLLDVRRILVVRSRARCLFVDTPSRRNPVPPMAYLDLVSAVGCRWRSLVESAT